MDSSDNGIGDAELSAQFPLAQLPFQRPDSSHIVFSQLRLSDPLSSSLPIRRTPWWQRRQSRHDCMTAIPRWSRPFKISQCSVPFVPIKMIDPGLTSSWAEERFRDEAMNTEASTVTIPPQIHCEIATVGNPCFQTSVPPCPLSTLGPAYPSAAGHLIPAFPSNHGPPVLARQVQYRQAGASSFLKSAAFPITSIGLPIEKTPAGNHFRGQGNLCRLGEHRDSPPGAMRQAAPSGAAASLYYIRGF